MKHSALLQEPMTTLSGFKENQKLPHKCLCTRRNAREQEQGGTEEEGRGTPGLCTWGTAQAPPAERACLGRTRQLPLPFPFAKMFFANWAGQQRAKQLPEHSQVFPNTLRAATAPPSLPACRQTPQCPSAQTAAQLKKENKMKWSNSPLSQHKVSLAGKLHFLFFLLHRLNPFCFFLSIPTFHIFSHSLFPDT